MHEALKRYGDFLRQPHVTESGALAWLTHPRVPQDIPMPNLIGLPPFEPGTPRALSPAKGEHSAAILAEHGFTANEIDALLKTGTVHAP